MRSFSRLAAPLLLGGLAASAACGAGDDGEVGSADLTGAPTACAIEDMSGAGLSPSAIAAKDDPFAKLVLAGAPSCPTSFRSVMDRLRETDAKDCTGASSIPGSDSPIPDLHPAPNPGSGVKVALVSERASLLQKAEGYRPVIVRECNQRGPSDLLFAPLGFSLDAQLAEDVELIAFDATRKVFDFYAVEGGKVRFFGDSIDLLQGHGEASSFQNQPRRCANCHAAGGLLMKELDSPWANWLGVMHPPRVDDVVAQLTKDLGVESITTFAAINLEDTVEAVAARVSDKTGKLLTRDEHDPHADDWWSPAVPNPCVGKDCEMPGDRVSIPPTQAVRRMTELGALLANCPGLTRGLDHIQLPAGTYTVQLSLNGSLISAPIQIVVD